MSGNGKVEPRGLEALEGARKVSVSPVFGLQGDRTFLLADTEEARGAALERWIEDAKQILRQRIDENERLQREPHRCIAQEDGINPEEAHWREASVLGMRLAFVRGVEAGVYLLKGGGTNARVIGDIQKRTDGGRFDLATRCKRRQMKMTEWVKPLIEKHKRADGI